MESDLKQSLISLMDAIKRSDSEALTREMARLDEQAAARERELPPRLAHFLQRRSYAKALAFLEEAAGRGWPPGGPPVP